MKPYSSKKEKYDCRYKVKLSDYSVARRGTIHEDVYIDSDVLEEYKRTRRVSDTYRRA